jgi:hypothetical protein
MRISMARHKWSVASNTDVVTQRNAKASKGKQKISFQSVTQGEQVLFSSIGV